MFDDWRDPAWPPEIEFQTDLEPSRWIAPLLLPWGRGSGTRVTSVVPTGYPAYVRVFHPAQGSWPLFRSVTWREVSAWSGRMYHPAMQFQRVAEPLSPGHAPPFEQAPHTGHLTTDLCSALYGLLSEWTPNAKCWLGMWEGWGCFGYPHSMSGFSDGPDDDRGLTELAARVESAPRFDHPGRSYLLARAPMSSVPELSKGPLSICPSLAWADDRTWCVGTEIDFDSTLVATSDQCAEALLADQRLEALKVDIEDRLDDGGDALND
jgi:hypothetical protein